MNALAQLTEDISLETPSLKSVILAGMTVNPSIVQRCQEVLGTSTLENFYGMTEGVFISTGPMADLTTAVLNDIVAIGKPISGAQVRVCDAKNGSTVPVGVEGVLHFSGATLVKGYMNCESDEFYNSENRTWFVTGDQAFMGNDKQLYIVGRHKDIIVRGGKNLSPSRIEDLLSQNPHFFALEPQVVAGEDDIAGEVPIVVTRVPTTDDMEDMMQKSICKNLGVHYTPRAWISLDSLGLDGFPRTSSGKIQMAKLKGLVANYMKAKEPAHTSHLSSTIVAIWSQLLGIQSSRLDTSAPVTQAADSILMLSARAKIKRQTGLGISLTEWLAIPTIAEQIETLERVGTRVHGNTEELTKSQGEIRSGPPRMEDMVHIGDDETAFHITKEIVEKILEKQEFSWEDVKDVFPCTDFIHILGRTRTPRSAITPPVSDILQEMRAALEKTLLVHPIMLSYLITDNELLDKELGLYVTMRHSTKILEKCILNFDSVDTLEQLRTLAMDYPFEDHAMLPGPLFRCLVVFVRETNSAAVISNSRCHIIPIILAF
ncbi:hypothetical protein N7468_003958 [Penicillium chermesinum]|uniref:Carrier domain-containing protein n=1 Tax=Penicillium chermesinum TaxID=63820 RepID=A0A9W9P7N5_9EURO|nr:uncharacterized protein N7468_003958 [Penicillium chermesinum]KAJ5239339.1 hypothetical protein N7468_003958 [Penicillium chermesinum]